MTMVRSSGWMRIRVEREARIVGGRTEVKESLPRGKVVGVEIQADCCPSGQGARLHTRFLSRECIG